tara:strand:- start:1175 stop:2125 length:951 start_codon:yes stop_codon:yes gene_type:complete
MGYRKIQNLYKPQSSEAVLMMDRCYAMEKIHGTSAHVGWRRKAEGNAKPAGFFNFPGGIKESTFMEMFLRLHPNFEALIAGAMDKLKDINEIVFFGEAYGGNCQKMSDVYGPLNFIVFEVRVNGKWLTPPESYDWAFGMQLGFVYYEEGPATLEFLNKMRDLPSQQAKRNGMGDDKIGEGIVIRAISEDMKDKFGERIIIKHKRAEFRETKSPREIDPEKQKRYAEARETAEEFVVEQRLLHVVDKLVATNPKFEYSMKNTTRVIGAMIGDVRKEEGDTIEWSKSIQTAIGNRTAKLWREFLELKTREEASLTQKG